MTAKQPELRSPVDFDHSYNGHSSDWIFERFSIVFISFILFIIFLGSTFSLCWQRLETRRDHVLASDKMTANLLADLLLEHNKATIGILQSYAQRLLFIKSVKNRDLEGVLRHLSNLKSNSDVDLTFISDKLGVVWANFPLFQETLGKDLSDRDWYKGISSNWKPYISKVFQLVVANKPLATAICVPIIDEDESILGVLGTSQRLGFLSNAIERVPLSPSTTVNVADRSGNFLYSNKFPYKGKVSGYPLFPFVEKALNEKSQQVEINDSQYEQRKINYLTVVPIREIGWIIIIERSFQDIFSLEQSRIIEICLTSFLLFLLIICFLVYLRKTYMFQKTKELLIAETRLRNLENSDLETKDYLEKLIRYANAPIIVWDPQFRITRFNQAFEHLTGFKEDEVREKQIGLLFPENLREGCLDFVRQTTGGQGWESIEIPILHKDGLISTVLWNSATIFNTNTKEVIATIAQGQDITVRKKAEAALKTSEDKYRSLFTSMISGFALLEMMYDGSDKPIDCRYIEVNPAHGKLTGLKKEAIIGRTARESIPGLEEFWIEKYSKVDKTGVPDYLENYVSGLKKWFGVYVYSTAPGFVVIMFEDITNRKESEKQIKASLLEKETLLKEIHHRVKNNMQVISSLLSLQSLYVEDEKVKEIFRECQGRIMAMAFVHSLLYKSKSLAEINFGEYVKELADQLIRSYQIGSLQINLIIQAENVMLSIETAIPFALIINELLTNALKYAFPEAGNGEIKIEMGQTENGVKLLFEDNGVGFSKEVDFQKPETFGLYLVNLLVKQLNGSIEQFKSNGTKYVINSHSITT
ncbi:MAG: PAS domain S-box protein [Candidatus Riflebacteria bacterium]|nr:PAS domain S-box protein [Candidatus Riflebacteria bacterium]